MLDFFKGKKTFIAMILAVISAFISFGLNEITIVECIALVLGSVGFGSLRADMIPGLSFFQKYRTYFIMIGSCVLAVIGYLTSAISLMEFITAIIGALGLGGFSAGIKKNLS